MSGGQSHERETLEQNNGYLFESGAHFSFAVQRGNQRGRGAVRRGRKRYGRFSGTDDAVAAAGSNFDLLNGVSASRDGADLTVRVTGVTASGDDDFVFTDGMSRLDTVKKDAVYTATVKADLKAGKVIVEWTKDGEPFNGEPAIDGEPTDVVPSFENKTVPPETPEPPEKIKTGDNENLAMWLLLAAVCAEAAFALIRRKYADR